MTTEQPLALRLADLCETLSGISDAYDEHAYRDAAAELRRQHAENVELSAKVRVAESGFHAAVQTAKWQESTNSELNRLMAQKAELHAENEALRAMSFVSKYADVQAENEALRSAITKLHKAKGRYHTQLAACDLFDLVGLPNERPKK
jgi:hypothetical protein